MAAAQMSTHKAVLKVRSKESQSACMHLEGRLFTSQTVFHPIIKRLLKIVVKYVNASFTTFGILLVCVIKPHAWLWKGQSQRHGDEVNPNSCTWFIHGDLRL